MNLFEQDVSTATTILIIYDSIGYLRNAPSCLWLWEGTSDPLDNDRFQVEKWGRGKKHRNNLNFISLYHSFTYDFTPCFPFSFRVFLLQSLLQSYVKKVLHSLLVIVSYKEIWFSYRVIFGELCIQLIILHSCLFIHVV